ncbi:hypothetical protein MSAN_02360900 [Mycena sanguinolenta]|uniref:Uncharacterized protein n=1 Tax=Mycena sanguinolenta TaxID=230812 RepID=A0A8H6X6E7_9AGAR|nr:hypothetical protein MSAN_02360900 [Mycena sanguinolenta]
MPPAFRHSTTPRPCYSSRARHLTRPHRASALAVVLTRCHRTFRRRRSSPRSRLVVVFHLRPTMAEGGSGGKGATRRRRRVFVSPPSSLPELPLRPSTPPFLFSTPAALDAAVPFLDVTVLDVARLSFWNALLFPTASGISMLPSAPLDSRPPPPFPTQRHCATLPAWSPVCEMEGGHDLQVMSSLHLTHRMAFFMRFFLTRLDVSQRVVALGGQQVAGIQLLGALTFSSRRNGDVLKNIEWALVPPK